MQHRLRPLFCRPLFSASFSAQYTYPLTEVLVYLQVSIIHWALCMSYGVPCARCPCVLCLPLLGKGHITSLSVWALLCNYSIMSTNTKLRVVTLPPAGMKLRRRGHLTHRRRFNSTDPPLQATGVAISCVVWTPGPLLARQTCRLVLLPVGRLANLSSVTRAERASRHVGCAAGPSLSVRGDDCIDNYNKLVIVAMLTTALTE